jgi:hypothetical protein
MPYPFARLSDALWRRVEVSRGAYVALAAGASLGLSGLAAALYYVVVTGLLGLDVPLEAPDRATPLVVDGLGMIVLAPLAETAVIALCVGIARRLTGREGVLVLAGALPLGLAHGVLGLTVADAGGHALVSAVSFLVFALTYVAWRRESFRAAFWVCAAVHAVHNAVVFMAMVTHALTTPA